MVNIIVELSKYLMILLMGIYTFSCFSIFAHNYESEQKWILIRQNVLMFLLQLTAYVVMYLKKDDPKILTLYAASAFSSGCDSVVPDFISEGVQADR